MNDLIITLYGAGFLLLNFMVGSPPAHTSRCIGVGDTDVDARSGEDHMRLLYLLLQGLLIAWSLTCAALLMAIAFVHARAAVLKLWKAVEPALHFRAVSRSPATPVRGGPGTLA
jgi:hypothetical protein